MPSSLQHSNQHLESVSPSQQAQGVNRHMYDQLKQQVQHMKLDQQEFYAVKAKQKELETVALLQQKLQYEQQSDSQQQEILALQTRLKDSVERASKLRQHFEKDKKVLTQQAERLQDTLAQIEQQHVEQLAAKDSVHLQQLQDIRSELEQRQQEWAEEKQALQRKQEAFMTEVEEWSQGEVEAVKAAAAARVQQAEQSAAQWKGRHQEAAADLEEMQRVEQQMQQQLHVTAREQDAKVCQIQAQHALQLDAVHVKLQGVLAKKDANIAALRAELDATMMQLQHELCREVLLPVAFDGADNAGVPSRQATVTRFRKTDVAHKRATFLGASKLLTGYSELTLSGEAVTDEVLLNIARTNGANLISVKLLGTTAVTDEGITALVSSAPLLKVFMLEDAGRGVAGTFVPAILQSCKQLESLHIEDSLEPLLERCPGLTELQLDGPALNIQAAAAACPNIKRLAFLVGSPVELDAALFYLNGMSCLRGLELEVKGMMLSTEQLRVIGMLPLRELSLDSHAYRQQPSMPRPQFSHLDNEGVKGLVDSICSRMRSDMMPLKLSLCGATALKQEAVSALLRLPMLTAIDTGGCIKLTPMDRMRLVAKVKAGQGMMDNRAGGGGSSALASLRVAHAHAL
ncbi:hypothetical protein OEZ85_005913 [Tetradesmus obliquus]|uniref:Uncharacterized protein n=1 Tax=Tetradesmus obliquus TaxID=3088 RepID=A0ABY8UHA2_TETOB|nr:hypothetical protein OEZ85_005913 [Tetradesmus obliquus]